jgi:hypothetical protein
MIRIFESCRARGGISPLARDGKRLKRSDPAESPALSFPRKRESSLDAAAPFALDSRLRGNDMGGGIIGAFVKRQTQALIAPGALSAESAVDRMAASLFRSFEAVNGALSARRLRRS